MARTRVSVRLGALTVSEIEYVPSIARQGQGPPAIMRRHCGGVSFADCREHKKRGVFPRKHLFKTPAHLSHTDLTTKGILLSIAKKFSEPYRYTGRVAGVGFVVKGDRH